MSKQLLILGESNGSSVGPHPLTLSDPAQGTQVALIVIGIVLLLIWIVRRVKYPQKLSLQYTPGRPNTLTVLHVIPLFLYWMLVQVLCLQLFRWLNVEDAQARVLAGILAQVLTLIPLLVMGHFCFRGGSVRGLGLSLRHWGYDSIRGLYGGLAVFPVCIGLLTVFTYLFSRLLPEAVESHPLLNILRASNLGGKMIVILSAGVLAPIVEELLFRGMLQSMLRRYLANPWHAIFITSTIFALFHLRTPQGIPSLFVLAVVLGYNYERCGRLWSSILIHMIFNGIVIVLHLIP